MSEQFDYTKLSGEWHNQLGSKMTLLADKNGGLCGTYNSAVGKAEDYYVLTGRYDVAPPLEKNAPVKGVSLGWIVSYRNNKRNAHSTATWSGQYFDDRGKERIVTHWLLTQSTDVHSIWNSANIGSDTFTRDKPSDGAGAGKTINKLTESRGSRNTYLRSFTTARSAQDRYGRFLSAHLWYVTHKYSYRDSFSSIDDHNRIHTPLTTPYTHGHTKSSDYSGIEVLGLLYYYRGLCRTNVTKL